jgi:Arc/MetJ-type ribon-helix-helix transcriptional regulator
VSKENFTEEMEGLSRTLLVEYTIGELTLKIITVNLPSKYIDSIKGLVGDSGLYPSRSELVRVAIRDYLVKELKIAKNITPLFNNTEECEEGFVHVPCEEVIGDTVMRNFKRYRIIDRAEKFSSSNTQ